MLKYATLKIEPINTAPMDGTEIIAYREDAGWFMARYCAPIDFLTMDEIEDMDPDDAEQKDWFCADFVVGARLEGNLIPSHWMPQPGPVDQ